ncbi:MAG: LPXTG cell wall anchor domain-containing protein [Candidatus Peregrinibacteria bacterium]|nr:LPXTG cell wall anchor domain-containing protein [Candidatus Peregrinibacteria bacterium]
MSSILRTSGRAIVLVFVMTVHVFLAYPALLVAPTYAAFTQCADDEDNDYDGDVDYPEDDGCSSTKDNTEDEDDEGEYTIDVTDSRTIVDEGDTLTYRITLRNGTRRQREVDVRFLQPSETRFLSASDGGDRSGDTVRWDNLVVARSSTRTLTVRVDVDDARDGDLLTAEVTSEGERDTDTTRVENNGDNDDDDDDDDDDDNDGDEFSLSVTDGTSTVERGDELTYRIRVENQRNSSSYADVIAYIPTYTTFVTANNSDSRSGDTVRWNNVSVGPDGSRTLSLTIRVRSDAPLERELTMRVTGGGGQASDRTRVVRTSSSSRSSTSRSGTTGDRVLLRKVADRSEVQPGDRVTYTIQVNNITGKRIRNIRVEDRYDDRYATVIGGGNDASYSGNRLRWDIDDLAIGEVWERSYTLEIDRTAPHSQQITNILTVDGPDIDSMSLTERVRTGRTGVIRTLPSTGAAYDSLFVAGTLFSGLGLTAVQRRRRKLLSV